VARGIGFRDIGVAHLQALQMGSECHLLPSAQDRAILKGKIVTASGPFAGARGREVKKALASRETREQDGTPAPSPLPVTGAGFSGGGDARHLSI